MNPTNAQVALQAAAMLTAAVIASPRSVLHEGDDAVLTTTNTADRFLAWLEGK